MAELADALDSGSSGSNTVQVQVLLPAPEKPTSFNLSVFQLSAPFGAWSLLRKWSCPADSEVSAEVSGALNFILCARIILHYAVRHNFTSALTDTSLKTARVRIHTQNCRKYLFRSPYTEKPTSFDLSVFQLSAPFGAWSLLCKWSCPADSEVSAEVSGALNFTSALAVYHVPQGIYH